jgi:inosine-uridine nucleoside N-ribohydrolase
VEKIIIDTDPGVDDALALAYAVKADLPVTALTTVYGNNLVESSTRNAGYIAKTFGTDWHIYEGASEPLEGEPRLSHAHGPRGLGKVVPTDEQITPAEPESAAAFYQRLAQGTEKFTLFCLGPLTNIADALTKNPSLPGKIGQMVIMGGAFTSEGANISPFAEFNFFNDPEAAEVTMNKIHEAEIDTTVIPSEVCNEVILTEADLNRLKEQDLLPDLQAIVGPYLDYYMRPTSEGNHQGAPLFDVLVPLYYQLHHKYPELFATSRARVAVVGNHELPEKGQTTAIWDEGSSIQICRSIDAAVVRAIVLETLGGKGTVS